MDSMDNIRERCEALAQWMEQWQQHTPPIKERRRWWPLAWQVAAVAALGLALGLPLSVQAETFRCDAGDVQCLIDAINTANANGDANTIRLAAGTYTLTVPDNPENGLPVITSPLTLTGRGADNTSIERDASAPRFRILQVATTGTLTLKRLTLRGGRTLPNGGGIFNRGTLTLIASRVTENNADSDGGGIWTGLDGSRLTLINSTVSGNNAGFGGGGIMVAGGTATLIDSTLSQNRADSGAGLRNGGTSGAGFGESGTVWIQTSTVSHNVGSTVAGGITNHGTLFLVNSTVDGNEGRALTGGMLNGGTATVINSTFSNNRSFFSHGGGITNNGGTLAVFNSTISHNSTSTIGQNTTDGGGGISNEQGTVTLYNTILAQNTAGGGPDDCSGVLRSLGHNLLGDLMDCSLTLQDTDRTGDPGLDEFTDDGTPGHGYFPLLPTSQARDAGNDAVCPRTDQLGRRRIGPCDIGAIEFRARDDRHHEEDDRHDKEHDDTDPVAAAQAAP